MNTKKEIFKEFSQSKDCIEINVSKEVVGIILGITDMVNRNIWFKI